MKLSVTGKLGALLGVFLLLPGLAASAQPVTDQSAALDFRSEALSESAAGIDAIIREGDPWELLDWSVTVRPSLLYREYLEGRRDQVLNPRVSAIMQVRFGERPLATAQRAIKLERAIAAHAVSEKRGVRDALLAHAELLLAQDAFAAAQDASAALDAAELAGREGIVPELLALERAAWGLEQAQSAALAHGLADEATYASIRFAIPGIELPEHPDVRMQQLRAAEAEARLLQAGPASALRDFRLGGSWRNENLDVDLETGLMAGRPGFRFALINPGGRARLEFRLSAEFVFGSGTDGAALQADLAAALEEVQAVADALVDAARIAQVDAGFAEDELTLAEQELAAAQAHLVQVTAALAAADGEALDVRDLTRLETDVTRAEREVNRLTTRVYRAWITYVRRTYDLIIATGGGWRIR